MFGLDEYFNGLIDEAKSPEEIKKILEYNFVKGKGVPQEVLDGVFDIDPTKKKSYTRWVLSQWDKYKKEIFDALADGRLKRMFKTFKNRAADGLDLTNMESFEKAMEYIPDVDPILYKDEDDLDNPENDFDIVYDSPDWTIAVPHTFEADKKLGKGCRWCTAGAFRDDDYYWKRYSAAGPLFINFDKRHSEVAPMDNKEYPYTRYQFLFEWENWAGELMDSDDHRINFKDIDMPEEVVEFYGEQNPKYKDMIEGNIADPADPAEAWAEYNEERWNRAVTLISNPSESEWLSLMPYQDDDRNLDVEYMIYDENDTSDPIANYYFNHEDCVVAKSDDGTAAVLRDVQGNYVLAYWEQYRYSGSFEVDRAQAYWTSSPLMFLKLYHDLAIVPISSNENTELQFVIDKNSNVPIEAESISNIFINENISNAANGVEDYADLYFCEIVYSDSSHGLFFYDGENVGTMIKKDFPNGNTFEATAQDGILIISAKRGDYKFGGGSEKGNLSICDDLGEIDGEEYCIVTDNGGLYNLYNITRRRCVFNEGFQAIDYFKSGNETLLELLNPQGRALYGMHLHDFLTPLCHEIRVLLNDNGFWAHTKDQSLLIFAAPKSGGYLEKREINNVNEVCKEFYSVESIPFLVVKFTDHSVNFVNVKEAKVVFEDKFTQYGIPNLNNGNMVRSNLCYGRRRDHEVGYCGIYNFMTGECVVENYRFGNGKMKELEGGLNIITLEDGYNILDINGRAMLPHNVDKICPLFTNRYKTLPIVDGGKLWFMNLSDGNMNLLPNDGIDISKFEMLKNSTYIGFPLFRYKGREFSIEFENGQLDVVLQYSPDGNSAETDIVMDEIKAIVLKQHAEIRESFNHILDKINNAFKDKN